MALRYEPVPFTNRGGDQDVRMHTNNRGGWFAVDTIQQLVIDHFIETGCFDRNLADAVGVVMEGDKDDG